jgi:tetratricopeptide (TPR) repeat protein
MATPETVPIDPSSQALQEPAPVDTETQVARLLTRADLQWSAGRFTEPPGDNAFETYQKVLELSPDNTQARERLVTLGRRQLSLQYFQKADKLLEQGQLDRSLEEIDQGLRLAPGDADLLDLKRRVEERILALETTAAPPAGRPSPASIDMNDPQALLARARDQWDAGRYIEPPGDNAYETYQRVLELQPDNHDARSGLLAIGRIRLGNQYQARAEQQLRDGDLQGSLAEVEQGLRLAPRHAGLLALRERLTEQLDGSSQ